MSAGSGEISADLKRSLVEHYEKQLARHGPTAEGMDWKDAASQQLRFRVLAEVCDLDGSSLHDVGAGAGHLIDFLRRRNPSVDYFGSDLSAEMVASARRLHPGVRFEQRDLLADGPRVPQESEERFDVVVCSGLFFVRLDHPEAVWQRFVFETVRRMFDLCRVAIAFNLMSDHVDWRGEHLYHAPPGPVLDFCRAELSRYVSLRHDYPLHEYTVYVYREPAPRG